MQIQEKIQESKEVIKSLIKEFKTPCVLCSFGKDSMVMLHLIRETVGNLPVVFFSWPQMPRKLEFAHKIIKEWDLEVYQCVPPVGSSVMHGNNKSEVMNHFALGQGVLKVPIGRCEPDFSSKDWLCGRDAFLHRPFGNFAWPWDVAFCGHKGSDKDEIMGTLTIDCFLKQTPASASLLYPLMKWTDKDISDYTLENGIPYNDKRYYRDLTELPDKTYNNDRFPYCNRCFKDDLGDTVICPKNNLPISSIKDLVPISNVKNEVSYIK